VIALLDYGAGNLTSVRKAFAALGAELQTPAAPADLSSVSAIIVPGVGHFDATCALDGHWRETIRARLREGVPVLGICLGLQWLFDGSSEAPDARGLGVFPGTCVKLVAPKVPHVGWNSLSLIHESPLTADIPDGAQVYFTHSYAAPVVDATVAVANHGQAFSAIVERDNVAAVQFHPEKSAEVGLKILRNWLGVHALQTHHRLP